MRAVRLCALTGVSLVGVALTASTAIAGPVHPQAHPGVGLGGASGSAGPAVSAGKKPQTTVGGGYLSKPGVTHEAQTYVTIPALTCPNGEDSAEVSLGAFAFRADGKVEAQAISDCQNGTAQYFIASDYEAENQFYQASETASAGDLVEITLEDDSSQTYMDAYDTTSGKDAQLTESGDSTEGAQLLIGSLNDSAYRTVVDFGSTTFYDPSFNSDGITSALAKKLTQYTNGVAQIKPKSYNKKKQRFGLVWEHS